MLNRVRAGKGLVWAIKFLAHSIGLGRGSFKPVDTGVKIKLI